MCKAPQMLRDGTMVGCRNCSQCFGRTVDDWTGRCIAESKFATAPFFVNLTYGRENGKVDHLRSALLTYSDVQKYFKRLRSDGYPARYFCVGEYGSLKGRAHWHVLIFWKGEVPPHEKSTRAKPVMFAQKHWQHGHSVWEPLNGSPEDTAAAVKYVCKYLNKTLGGPEKQSKCHMSKVPLLGAEWIKHRAKLHAEQGLAPQDLFYSFPDLPEKRFMLRPHSAAAKLFCQSFVDEWEKARPGRPIPPSKMIEEYLDPGAWAGRVENGSLPWRSEIGNSCPTWTVLGHLAAVAGQEALEAARLRDRSVYGPGFNLHPVQS